MIGKREELMAVLTRHFGTPFDPNKVLPEIIDIFREPDLLDDLGCIRLVNSTPELSSFLYDADLMPEQCQEGSVNRGRMRMICNLWNRRVNK